MIEPVLSSIRGEGKMAYGIFVDCVIKLKEKTDAGTGKDCVGSHIMNVIV
jgi:hypothetical protein